MRTAHDARARLIDGGVAAAVLGVSWLSVFVAHDVGGGEADSLIPVWSEYLLLAVMIAPLAWPGTCSTTPRPSASTSSCSAAMPSWSTRASWSPHGCWVTRPADP